MQKYFVYVQLELCGNFEPISFGTSTLLWVWTRIKYDLRKDLYSSAYINDRQVLVFLFQKKFFVKKLYKFDPAFWVYMLLKIKEYLNDNMLPNIRDWNNRSEWPTSPVSIATMDKGTLASCIFRFRLINRIPGLMAMWKLLN